jgi:hypothetical protein
MTPEAQDPTEPTFVGSDALRRNLRRDFDPAQIGHTDKGFGPVDTINHAHVTNRLNEAAPGWTYELTRFIEANGYMAPAPSGEMRNGKPVMVFVADPNGPLHLMAVFGWMEVGGVRRWEVGEVENVTTYGDEMKKAISDFVKRGAMRFGVGISLWAKEPLEESAGTTGTSAAPPQQVVRDDSPSPASEPAPAATGATSEALGSLPGSGGVAPVTTSPEDRVVDPDAEGASGGNTSREAASGDGRLGEGSDLAASLDPIAGPDDWKRAARELKTSQAQAQVQVVEFLKLAQTGVKQPSQVTVDLLNFAVPGIVLGRKTSPPTERKTG